MTAVLRSSPQFPSSPSSPLSCSSNHGSHSLLTPASDCGEADVDEERKRGSEERRDEERECVREEVEQLSTLAFILTVLRKVRCSTEGEEDSRGMEIGWPTNVRHVAHVTFDRFHGFLGLPVEFEPEVPRRVPSASAKVFGVSTESMQCSYDCRGNSVPSILMLLQKSLYDQGGLKAEGIFRINAENSQEEFVRDQLNNGVVPDGIDVHCLAGLIKAWFRELPTGVLDPLSPEQVMQCQSEEECGQLAGGLPLAEASLLNWAINLMVDVVQEEHENKMNARNVAMVFAPNMTQMADPLTALMYAVQVMNFLKMLILKTLKERQAFVLPDSQTPCSNSHDENSHHSPELQLELSLEDRTDPPFDWKDRISDDPSCLTEEQNIVEDAHESPTTESSTTVPETNSQIPAEVHANSGRTQAGTLNRKKSSRKFRRQSTIKSFTTMDMEKGGGIVSRINTKSERVEAWR